MNIGAEDTCVALHDDVEHDDRDERHLTLSAVARDTSGNITTVNLTVTVEHAARRLDEHAGRQLDGLGSAVTVAANVSDNVGVVGVQYKLDGVNLGAEVTVAPFSLTWNTTAVIDTTHTLAAVARDMAGNTATSATINFSVNNPPTVIGTTPPPGGTNVATNAY